MVRGCITSGEKRLVFVFKASDDASGRVLYLQSELITLGADLQGLPLILGLLSDLVCPTLYTYLFHG